jgi:hypothetical protein
VGERQAGDEPGERAEGERNQTLPERPTLGPQGRPEVARAGAEGHNGSLKGSLCFRRRFGPVGPEAVCPRGYCETTVASTQSRVRNSQNARPA